MITLAAADYLSAGSTAGSVVTFTIFGMELNAGTEVYKVLAQGQVAASHTTIYTAPTNTTGFIKAMTFVNNDTVTRTLELMRGGTASANRITPIISILPGGMACYEDAMGWQFFNSAGQLLTATGMPNNGIQPNYGISGSLAETMDRSTCPEVNSVIGTSGQIRVQAIWLTAGQTVTNISFHSATTAAGTPTHYVFALYDMNRNLLATTPDQTSTAWAANTLKTIAVTSPYVVPTTGLYYLMISVVATTVPTLKGGVAKTGGQLGGQAPILNGLSSTTYATGTAPASLGAITANNLVAIWGCVS